MDRCLSIQWCGCLLAWAAGCVVFNGTTSHAQISSQLRAQLDYDAQLQALQQAWEGNDIERCRKLLSSLKPAGDAEDLRSFPWYYINSAINQVEVIPDFHAGRLFISSDNRLVFVPLYEQVDVWDLVTKRKVARLPIKYVDTVDFSGDGRFAALSAHSVGSTEKSLDIYALQDFKRVASFPNADDAKFSPDSSHVVVVDDDKVEVLLVDTWKLKFRVLGPGKHIGSIRFSSDGSYIAAGGSDDAVRLWRVRDGVQVLEALVDTPDDVLFVDNPSRMIVAERGGHLRAWDLTEFKEQKLFQGDVTAGGNGPVKVSYDQKYIVTSSRYGELGWIEMWELSTGRQVGKLEQSDVDFAFDFIGQSNRLAVANDAGLMTVWDLEAMKKESEFAIEKPMSLSMYEGLCCGSDGTIYWPSHNKLSLLRLGTQKVSEAQPGSSTTQKSSGSNMLWRGIRGLEAGNLGSGAVRTIEIPGPVNLSNVSVSANGKTLIGVANNCQVLVWQDLAKQPVSIQLNTNAPDAQYTPDVSCLAISASGRYMAASGLFVPLQLWDLQSRAQIAVFPNTWRQDERNISVSDMQMIATVNDRDAKKVDLWKSGTSAPHTLLSGEALEGVQFSPDGQLLIISGGPTIKVWSTQDAKQLAEHEFKNNWQSYYGKACIVFVPQKNTLIIDDRNGGLQEIEPISGKKLQRFSCDYWTDESWNLFLSPRPRNLNNMIVGGLMSLAISADGTRLAAQYGDGTIYHWDTSSGRGTHKSERMNAGYTIALDESGQNLICGEGQPVRSKVGSEQWESIPSPQGPQFAQFFSQSQNRCAVACRKYPGPSNIVSQQGLWSIHVVDLETGHVNSQFAFASGIDSIALSPDHSLVAVGSRDQSTTDGWIYVCNAASGEIIAKLKGRYDQLYFTPDGKYLLGASGGDHPLVMPPSALSQRISTTQFSALAMVASKRGDKLLALGVDGGMIELWDYEHFKLVQTLPGHPGTVNAIAFTPDGLHLASSGTDKQIRYWSLNTGLQVWSKRCAQQIHQLQFDEAGHSLSVRTKLNAFHILRGEP